MPELVLDKSLETVGGWEEDWDPMVPGLVEADTPCFILKKRAKRCKITIMYFILIINRPTLMKMLLGITHLLPLAILTLS